MCVARSALVTPWLRVSAGVTQDCESFLFNMRNRSGPPSVHCWGFECGNTAVSQVYIAGDLNAELQRFANCTCKG